jgi:Holliday junction DNA helicase RuvA
MASFIPADLGVTIADLIDKETPPHSSLLPLYPFSMIAYLRGVVLEKHPNAVVVETNGVGYEVTIPVSAYSSLPEKGAEVRLHIHTHVREDALALFGFISPSDKALFEKLITVSGIGPKLAVTALSGLAAPELAAAIRSGAVEQLVRIPGVGKKTAERMVLELRDKLDLTGLPARPEAAAAKPAFDAVEEDVISALMNFGATRSAGEAAVGKARSTGEPNDFDALFRRALKLVR